MSRTVKGLMASPVVEESIPLMVEPGEERHEIPSGDSPNPIDVDFDPNGDQDNPLEWPAPLKRGIVALLASMAFTCTFNCVSVAPIANRIADDLAGGTGTKSTAVLLTTIWELGEAAGPLLIAPLSEMFGRHPVLNVANVLFILATLLAVLSQSTGLFMAARALTGMAVPSNVLNPAIVGDIFAPEQRGTAMSLCLFATLVGGTIGAAISGAIAQSLGWRTTLWISIALASICEFLIFTYFRETYRGCILRRRAAARLCKETGNTSPTGVFRKEGKGAPFEKGSAGLRGSMMRPAKLLFGSGVLAALSLFNSVTFAFYYIISVSLPTILEERYGLSTAETGSAFLANGVGSITAILICKVGLDKIYVRLRAANNGIGQPEYRLPIAIVGAFMLPPAVVLYGWCAEYKLPLPLLLLSVVCVRLCITLATVPVTTYVVDAYGPYSASSVTGLIVTRCLAGTFLPLATTVMIDHLGYSRGFTVFGAVTLVLALIPVLILCYGSHWRQFSQYTRTAGGL